MSRYNPAMDGVPSDRGALEPSLFWAEILSRDPDRIHRALAGLPREDRLAVLDHLGRMATEPDWHPLQRESAKTALSAIKSLGTLRHSEDKA